MSLQIRIDTSALTYPLFLIPGHTNWIGNGGQASVTLAAGRRPTSTAAQAVAAPIR